MLIAGPFLKRAPCSNRDERETKRTRSVVVTTIDEGFS
jgi:hypothetical protein